MGLATILEVAKVKPAVNQIRLNVIVHDMQTIEFSTQQGIQVEAFSPLGRSGESGNITGNKIVQEIASNHNRSTYQVALKWILQHGWTLTFQSSSEAHQASDAEVQKLDGIAPSSIIV